MSAPPEITFAFLDAFADAWNRHDVDAILSMMTSNCIFEASSGPDVKGARYIGQTEVRHAIEDVFAGFPDAVWQSPHHFIAGDRGVSEWVFKGTARDGTQVEVQGCDVFTFVDGKIAIKNSYRKHRSVALPRSHDIADLPSPV